MIRAFPFLVLALVISYCVFSVIETEALPEELQVEGNAVTASIAEKIEIHNEKAYHNYLIAIGAGIGASMVSLLTVGGGFAVRKGILFGAVLGVILGGGLGAAGGFASKLALEDLLASGQDKFTSGIGMQLAFWIPIGLALALATSIARISDLQKAVMLVLMFGISAAIYPMAASVLFPLLQSDRIAPQGTENQVLWIALPVFLATLVLIQKPKQKDVQEDGAEESEIAD